MWNIGSLHKKTQAPACDNMNHPCFAALEKGFKWPQVNKSLNAFTKSLSGIGRDLSNKTYQQHLTPYRQKIMARHWNAKSYYPSVLFVCRFSNSAPYLAMLYLCGALISGIICKFTAKENFFLPNACKAVSRKYIKKRKWKISPGAKNQVVCKRGTYATQCN